MTDKNNSNNPSDASIMMLVMVLMLGVLAKNIDYLEQWVIQHWFVLSVFGIGIIYAITRYMKWKFKMKHPEMYEREMAIKQMQNKRDHNDYR
ncbi:hypothetical protein [Pseudobdellovibrio sp. HCB154]|uniref:hypothetical protein n=1 Tax=Pseudobdellovibrio sp. HCB154 TaxID=3386277 RepID=UPI0039174A07